MQIVPSGRADDAGVTLRPLHDRLKEIFPISDNVQDLTATGTRLAIYTIRETTRTTNRHGTSIRNP